MLGLKPLVVFPAISLCIAAFKGLIQRKMTNDSAPFLRVLLAHPIDLAGIPLALFIGSYCGFSACEDCLGRSSGLGLLVGILAFVLVAFYAAAMALSAVINAAVLGGSTGGGRPTAPGEPFDSAEHAHKIPVFYLFIAYMICGAMFLVYSMCWYGRIIAV